MFENEYEKAINGMLSGEGTLTCALSIFNFIEKNNQKTNACGIFTVGLASDWEGNLYPCQSAFLLGKKLCIGSIYSGINSHKNEIIRRDIFNSISQSVSSKKYEIASFCPISVYQKHNSFQGPSNDEFCQMIDIKAKLVAKYYYEIKKYCKKTNPTF